MCNDNNKNEIFKKSCGKGKNGFTRYFIENRETSSRHWWWHWLSLGVSHLRVTLGHQMLITNIETWFFKLPVVTKDSDYWPYPTHIYVNRALYDRIALGRNIYSPNQQINLNPVYVLILQMALPYTNRTLTLVIALPAEVLTPNISRHSTDCKNTQAF